jgi:ankyrin repeat protein
MRTYSFSPCFVTSVTAVALDVSAVGKLTESCFCHFQWIDKEGRTPLMASCMRPDLLNVAKVLIELGANVNAYRPGMCLSCSLLHVIVTLDYYLYSYDR